MNLKDLSALIKDGNFIEGVYNYCDRWCERCPLVSKCLLYAQDREKSEEGLGLEDESFWKALESKLSDTREIIMESAQEHGIDPEVLTQAAAQEPARLRLDPNDDPLSRSALEYAGMVKAWFDEEPGPTVPGLIWDEPADEMEEAVAVVRWFQFQIAVKLTTALNSRLDEGEEEDQKTPGWQPHSDGCAKVALIGIERSIAAWGILLRYFSGKSGNIRSVLLRLETLRRETDEAFPGARSFMRPGFDFMPTID